MRRILAWVVVCAFGLLLAAAVPYVLLAQQVQMPAEAAARFEPGRLGAELLGLSEQSVKALGLTQEHAILVVLPLPGGPAERAGLRPGDVIVGMDGAPVGALQDLIGAIQRLGAGRAITLDTLRSNERVAIAATLGRQADNQKVAGLADLEEERFAAHESILRLLDPKTFALDRAVVQSDRGTAYRNRTRGDWADNLEKAIAAYGAALTVMTREALPRDWAATQNNLGIAYETRIRGDRAENLEKAIAAYEAALTVRTREALPRDWAATQNNLGVAYRARIRGDQAENLEKSIIAYEAAMTVWTREALPHEWATVQLNLAVAYETRIRGDRADNLERAIAASEAALTVTTREALPREWAKTQLNLGVAYETRIRGERADNLEKAIAAFKAALTVTTREALPREWAKTQNNLGVAYRSRIRGERADNLERAIAASEAALTVMTREALPHEWADAQINLGAAYWSRIHGERADNLERAIAAYETALTVRTREALPRAWAETQSNLGVAYETRIRGERADNLEKAIAAYEAALTVRTREALPREWAGTQVNLGVANWIRIRGDRAENLERAIAAYEAALTVRTREALASEWAETQNNLGVAYWSRIRGERADNLERAIAAHEAALTVRTREALPREWAETQSNLGVAYETRIRGERAGNLEKAITAYEAALTVTTREALPRDHLRIGQQLGGVLSEGRAWRRADQAYASARDAFLLLFGQGLNEAGAQNLIGAAGLLFAEAAFAAVELGDSEKALALASEGRARLMAVALKLQTLDLPGEKRRRLDTLRADIRLQERAAEATQGADRAAAVEKLVGLRQELLGLVNDADAAAATGRTSALEQARALAGKGGAVVVPIVTRFGVKILIVRSGLDPAVLTPGHNRRGVGAERAASAGRSTASAPASTRALGLTPLDLPELTTASLDALIRGGDKTGGWLDAYDINDITNDEELERRWPEWLAAINGLGPELWRLFGARLDAALKGAGVPKGARIVWQPTGALGILPLGLAQNPGSKHRLADDYEIVYAPNLDALASAQVQIARPAPATLAAVVNPTGDLAAAGQEGRLVASRFPSNARTVLEGSAATADAVLAALKGRSYWHFASHGTFSWTDARKSGLYMAGPDLLSVGRLLEADGLGRPRLVVLSACETGLYDISRNPDEFIGLPGTFTALGAAGVLGTLWPVSDTATALLIAKFYELHLGERVPPPTALRRAQLWLRQASNLDFIAYANAAARQGRLDKYHVAAIAEELSEMGLKRSRKAALVQWVAPKTPPGKPAPSVRGERLAQPYAHPYYWAGFIYTGL